MNPQVVHASQQGNYFNGYKKDIGKYFNMFWNKQWNTVICTDYRNIEIYNNTEYNNKEMQNQ